MGKGARNRIAREATRLGPYMAPRRGEIRSLEDPRVARVGSDRKAKGTSSLGRCFLCTQEHALRLSHTIPRWAYRKIHALEGGPLVGYRGTRAWSFESDDGDKHYLLCDACEQRLGQGERALAKFSSEQPPDSLEIGVTVTRIDEASFQLAGRGLTLLHRAVLGIVFKLAVAPTSSVWIPTPTIGRLRRALLTDDYTGFGGPNAIKWYTVDEIKGANPRAYAGSLSFRGYGQGDGLSIGLGGIDWLIPLTPKGNVDDAWRMVTAPVVGRMHWFENDWEHFLDEWEGSWPEDGQRTPDAAECPCGSGKTFAECCQLGWLAT